MVPIIAYTENDIKKVAEGKTKEIFTISNHDEVSDIYEQFSPFPVFLGQRFRCRYRICTDHNVNKNLYDSKASDVIELFLWNSVSLN